MEAKCSACDKHCGDCVACQECKCANCEEVPPLESVYDNLSDVERELSEDFATLLSQEETQLELNVSVQVRAPVKQITYEFAVGRAPIEALPHLKEPDEEELLTVSEHLLPIIHMQVGHKYIFNLQGVDEFFFSRSAKRAFLAARFPVRKLADDVVVFVPEAGYPPYFYYHGPEGVLGGLVRLDV